MEQKKRIGIIGAMELEIAQLKSHMTNVSVEKKAGMEFHTGLLQNVDVVVVRSGIGKVNAALCVQILADLFHVTHVINTGIAGSLDASLNIGDILVSSEAAYHDMDTTIFGYRPGEVPQMGLLYFPADDTMARLAVDTCREVNPDIRSLMGRIVSGDQFIADHDVKERIIKTFSANAVEMEGAAIAHGAYLNRIPFVIIRAISDKADGSAHMDYPTFEEAAARHSAALVEAMTARL